MTSTEMRRHPGRSEAEIRDPGTPAVVVFLDPGSARLRRSSGMTARFRAMAEGSDMLRMIGARLMTTIPSVIGVIIVTFLLTRVLPGDTAAYFAGPAATPQAIAEIRSKLGLDQPLPVQFFSLCHGAGEGRSRPVADHRPAGDGRSRGAPAGLGRADAAGCWSRPWRSPCRSACWPPREAGLLDRPSLPGGRDGRRLAAGVLHRAAAGLCLLFQARLVAGAARAARRLRLEPPNVTGFYLIDSLLRA
jgi:hypothetical protein